MDVRLVYITVGNMDEARAIGRGLVSARVAACANIIHPVHSMYWWEGEVQEDTEVIVLAKTREDLVDDLIEKVKSLHSYECPCIVTLPILEGYGPFLEWVLQETRKTGGE
jgi:periplasmic divalent cation tolerance protein